MVVLCGRALATLDSMIKSLNAQKGRGPHNPESVEVGIPTIALVLMREKLIFKSEH
jgi:hypothetical protein